MRRFWNTKGRRIAAFFIAIFVLLMAIPCSNYGVLNVSADETGYTIAVNAEDEESDVVTYTITTSQTGNGTIALEGGNISDNTVSVEEATDLTFILTPETGYEVSGLSVDSVPVEFSKCTVNTDGSYKYAMTNIDGNKEFSVEFTEIAAEIKSITETMEEVGTLWDKEGEEIIIADNVTTYYAAEMTLTANSDKLIRLADGDVYVSSIPFTSSRNLEFIYIRDKDPTDFGSESKLVFVNQISLIVDSEKPVVILDETTKNVAASATTVEITGSVAEENLDYVICSDIQLPPDQVLADTGNVPVAEDGTFTYTATLIDGEDSAGFYFYAVDKGGLCSDEESVTVLRDNTPPVISNVKINTAINSYAHGNYSNETVSLTVTAKDVEDSGVVTGIRAINLYVDGTFYKIVEVDENTTVADDSPYAFAVELPLENTMFASLAKLEIEAVDHSGNISETRASLAGEGMTSDKLMQEAQAPVITVTVPEGGYVKNATDTAGEVWYKSLSDAIDYEVTDSASGLLESVVCLDGSEIAAHTKDYSTEGTMQPVVNETITTEELENVTFGKNVIEILSTDNAGNESMYTQTIGIDNAAPVVTEMVFEEVEDTTTLSGLVGFSNYFHSKVRITVTVKDVAEKDGVDDTRESVGAEKVTLILDGEETDTQTVDENNQVVFVIPENLPENWFVAYEKVSVKVSDFLGNSEEYYVVGSADSNGSLIIENKKPVVTVNIGTNGQKAASEDEPLKFYYSKLDEDGIPLIDFVVDATEEGSNSGLKNILAELNGKAAYEKNFEEAQLFALYSGKVMFDLRTIPVSDSYEGTVTVTDNAENATVIAVEIQKDMEGAIVGTPEVTEPFSKVSGISYYKNTVAVTVTPTDNGVGVSAIEWGIIAEDGSEEKEATVEVNENGKASFAVNASGNATYEEKIYIKAIDKLGNAGETITLDKIIIETQALHDAADAVEPHVVNEILTTTPYKDGSGNPLYTGANAEKVAIKTSITDTYNGIRNIEWTVKSESASYAELGGSVSVNNGVFDSTSGTWSVDESSDFVTKVSGEIEIDVAGIEANNVVVSIIMTDHSGNKTTKDTVFSIDRTAPVISVSFDEVAADSEYPNIYKENRTATITVTDRNFGEEQLALEITNTDGAVPQATGWTTTVNTENPGQTTSTATIVFSEEGDYTVRIGGKDLAGQAADTISADEFTIDKTVPVITVTYANDNAMNGNYYAETQTAIIEIEEHNFAEERIEITGTATVDGVATAFPTLSAWSSNGDTHTATITFDADALYQFNVDYMDKAGNGAEQHVGEEFYVDMTAPEIEISGVEDMSANNGDVIPRVSLTDSNYDTNGVSIHLYGANNGNMNLEGSYNVQANGQIYTFNNFPKEQSRDDIYTLSATVTDMAGNEATDEITFSVNRFGSVYVFDDSLKEIAGSYVQEEIDVRLTEVNVDSLEHDTIRVVVDANGTLTDLEEGIDYTVVETGGNGAWYQYDYTIDKSLFAGDGRYIVTLYSEDVAGNVNENIDETKEAEISFGIDKTPPVIIPIDIASEEQYDLDIKTATVTVNDNLVLEDVQVFIGEKQIEYSADGENYMFDIPSASGRQDISIAAIDAAGNRTNYVISGVLVTTNAFIRWYSNTPLFVGSIAGVAVLSGAGVGFIGLRRKRRTKLK